MKDIKFWIKTNKLRTIGLIIILILIFIALFDQYLAPYTMNERDMSFLHPSWTHLLGTNDIGQDIFSELIYSARTSLAVGFLSAFIAISVGVVVGTVAGYRRGKTEQVLMAMTDAVIIIPGLPLMILMVAYLQPGIVTTSIAISILGWCGMARVLHPKVMNLKEQPFVMSAKALGKSDWYIMLKHILPNTKNIISVKLALAVGGGMMAEASLSFMGLGDPMNSSWGAMMNDAFTYGAIPYGLWWWYLVPGIMIMISIISFILISSNGRSKGSVIE